MDRQNYYCYSRFYNYYICFQFVNYLRALNIDNRSLGENRQIIYSDNNNINITYKV
jgi:hypothetical protein